MGMDMGMDSGGGDNEDGDSVSVRPIKDRICNTRAEAIASMTESSKAGPEEEEEEEGLAASCSFRGTLL